MALSGSIYKNVGSHWRLQLEWVASQNVGNNTSTITAYLYWMATTSYGATSSSATKDGAITIEGSTATFSGAGLASLSGNQKKLIKSYQVTKTHASDGSLRIDLSAYFDVELTLSGTYYGRVSVSGAWDLNDIPRASTLSSSASWTAGSSLPISISRASSSFVHSVYVDVNGVRIAYQPNVGYSHTFNFDVAENTSIFQQLNTGVSQDTKIIIVTYSGVGGSEIGRKEYTGTVTAPQRSVTTLTRDFNIGDTISGQITENDSEFTHTIQLLFGGSTYTLFTRTTALSWSYDTSAIASSLYSKTPNSNTLDGTLRMYTYYNGVQVRSYVEGDITCRVTNSTPDFSATQISYADINATTKALTGNDQYIIQGYSDLRATILSSATAVNSATIVRYEITVNGTTEPLTAIGSKDFGKINASNDITLQVKAVDSRGNSKIVTKTINIVPYKKPVLTPVVKRLNGFENQTTISLSGSFSLISINGVTKNSISELSYKIKESTVTTYPTAVNFAKTITGSTYKATDVVLNLNNQNSYNIEFYIKDKITDDKSYKTVAVGQPIFFIDGVKKSVGVGKFPMASDRFEVAGDIQLGGNVVMGGGSTVTGLNQIGVVHAGNNTATASLSFKDDIPRIRYGGSGAGASNGFEIQGTGDSTKFKIYDNGDVEVFNNLYSRGVVTGRFEPNRIYAGENLNNYQTPGFFFCPSTADTASIANTPTNSAFSLLVEGHAGTRQTFTTYFAGDSMRTWCRNRYTTSWGPWMEVSYMTDWGTNGNGRYVKYSNNIMICSVAGTTTMALNAYTGGIYQNTVRWTYPATFASSPAVTIGKMQWGTGASWGGVASLTASYCDLRCIDSTSRASGSVDFTAMAMGAWK